MLFLLINYTQAQIITQSSLVQFDKQSVNPAYCGAKKTNEVKLHHRSQWVGFTDAPQYQSISGTMMTGRAVGLGAKIFNYSSKGIQNYGGNINYAYHLPFNKVNLSLGAGMGFSQIAINTSDHVIYESGDDLLNKGVEKSKLLVDMSAGGFAYNKDFYAGISSIYKSKVNFSDLESDLIPSGFAYTLMAGYNYRINKHFLIIPNAVAVKPLNYKFNYQVGVAGVYHDMIMLSANYRQNDAFVLSAGIKLFDNWLFMYSYDMVTSELKNYNSGSHEIILAYLFKPRTGKAVYSSRGFEQRNISFWN